MGRKGKIVFGIITIIAVCISSIIGLIFLPNDTKYEIVLRFFCMFAPCMTILCVINLLKKINEQA